MSEKSIITFVLPTKKKKILQRIAHALDVDLSTILRDLIDEYLGEKKSKKDNSKHKLLQALEILEDEPLREEFANMLLTIRKETNQ